MTPGGTPLPPVGMDPMIPGFYYPLLLPAVPAYQLQNRGHRAPARSPCHPISWWHQASFLKDPPNHTTSLKMGANG